MFFVMDHKLMSRCVSINQDFNPIAWVNMPVYDFKGRLPRGNLVLPLWQFEAVLLDEPCHPIGEILWGLF